MTFYPKDVALWTQNQMLEPASTESINKELEFPRAVYSFKHSPGNLRILEKIDNPGSVVDWAFE